MGSQDIPCVSNDDVVEGVVCAPKAREPDLHNHFLGCVSEGDGRKELI